MDRQYVVENELVERYLRDQLGVEQAEAFEQFFITCPETMDDLELARALRKGMKEAMASPGSAMAQQPTWLARLLKAPLLPAVATLAVVLLAVPWFFAATVDEDPASVEILNPYRLNVPLLRSAADGFQPSAVGPASSGAPVTLVLELGYSDFELHQVRVIPYGSEIPEGVSSPDLKLRGEGDLEYTLALPSGQFIAVVEGVESGAEPEEIARFQFQIQ